MEPDGSLQCSQSPLLKPVHVSACCSLISASYLYPLSLTWGFLADLSTKPYISIETHPAILEIMPVTSAVICHNKDVPYIVSPSTAALPLIKRASTGTSCSSRGQDKRDNSILWRIQILKLSIMPPNVSGRVSYWKGPAFELGPETSVGMLQFLSTYFAIYYFRIIPLFGAHGEGLFTHGGHCTFSFYARSQHFEKRLLASSCLSVRHGTTRLTLDGFSWNLIF
jgi:hypothetical protein